MHKTMIAAAIALVGLSMSAYATTHKEAPTMQQSKMATCNKEAAGKKGDERRAFMKECLSAKKVSQQDRMKQCNTGAEGKAGDERKKFMSECLKSGVPRRP